jgi:hypothetical protein
MVNYYYFWIKLSLCNTECIFKRISAGLSPQRGQQDDLPNQIEAIYISISRADNIVTGRIHYSG